MTHRTATPARGGGERGAGGGANEIPQKQDMKFGKTYDSTICIYILVYIDQSNKYLLHTCPCVYVYTYVCVCMCIFGFITIKSAKMFGCNVLEISDHFSLAVIKANYHTVTTFVCSIK